MSDLDIANTVNDPVIQFSVFSENRVGRLLEIINLLDAHGVHPMALSVLDSTEASIIRLVTDNPDRTHLLFEEHGIPYAASEVVAAEMDAVTDFKNILRALLQAEVNLHYIYSLLSRPQEKSGIVIHGEHPEYIVDVLKKNRFKVISQSDISR
jgi:hypothetical protein